MKTPRALMLVVTGLFLVAAPLRGQFVVPEGSNFHNGSTLPQLDDGPGELQLRKLQNALREGSVGAALDTLRLLRADRRGVLVEWGPRTHVPVLERAAQLVAASDAREVQRAIDADARRAIDLARGRRDIDALVDWATRGRALPASSLAAETAARMLFEAGHWWAAAAMARLVEAPSDALRELRRRAEARTDEADALPDEPSAAGDLFSWRWALGVRHALDGEPETGLPLVIDGRRDELLIIDSLGLHGFDPVQQTRTLTSFRWTEEVAAQVRERRFVTSLPAPARFTAARSGSRLVVPFNTPFDINRARSPRVPRRGHLVATDLLDRDVAVGDQRSAVLAWMAQSPRGGAGAAFGPPLIRGQRVFAQVYRAGLQTEVSLACFDLASGKALWETPLARGGIVQRYASRLAETALSLIPKRAGTAPLAEHAGVIYACTGVGVLAAVDGWSGAIRHTFRYDRNFALDASTFDPSYLFDPHPPGWLEEPVRVWRDRIVVAPSDSRYLYTLAPEPSPEGYVILDDPIERLDRLHIVGLRDDPSGGASPAILATQRRDNRLGGVLNGSDGHVAQRTASLATGDSELMDWDSRPIDAGSAVLVPTSSGVHVFDISAPGVAPRLLRGPTLGAALPTAMLHRTSGALVGLTPDLRDGSVLLQVWLDEDP